MALADVAAIGNDGEKWLFIFERRFDHRFSIACHVFDERVDVGCIKMIEVYGERFGDFIGDWGLQEADGGAYTCATRHNDFGDADFFSEATGMKWCTAAKGHHGAFGDVFAAFDGMHTRGIGHVFFNDFGNTCGGPEIFEI